MVFIKKINLPFVLALMLMFIAHSTFAQGDFMVLKKNNKTIKRIFTGDNFSFSTNSGSYFEGLIYATKNDSIIIQQFVIKQIPTTIGTYIFDTLGSMKYSVNYKDIYTIGEPKRGFNFLASGNSLMGGSIVLIVGSGVVYLLDRNKFSPELLIGSAVLGGVGYLLARSGSKGIVIGKRGYRLDYIHL